MRLNAKIQRGIVVRRVASATLGLVLSSLLYLSAFAHDPYEITSTIRLETNRTLVEVEMEFTGAMLLAGGARPTPASDQTGLFQSKLPDLRSQAGQFFKLSNSGGALVATSTNVTLGVENHVKFSLEYPPTRTGVELNATALKRLAEQGPFGTTVTVLDMVNKIVLGQTVLFSNSPAASFAPRDNPALNAPAVARSTNTFNSKPAPSIKPGATSSSADQRRSTKESIWNFVILVFFGVLLLVLLRRWRAAGGSQ